MFEGLLKVTVVEDDVRALATQFQSDTLEVGLRRRFHNLAARDAATCGRDFAHVGVFSESLAANPRDHREGGREDRKVLILMRMVLKLASSRRVDTYVGLTGSPSYSAPHVSLDKDITR